MEKRFEKVDQFNNKIDVLIQSKIIEWKLPLDIPTNEEATKTMNKIIEHEIIYWENIPPSPLNNSPIESTDFSSLQSIVPSLVNAVDQNNYYYMSQTETTDFLYHAAVYGVSAVERVTLYGMDVVRLILN